MTNFNIYDTIYSMWKELFKINLKYFKDSNDNYIIYRKANQIDSFNSLKSQNISIRDVILPKDSPTDFEKIFDELAQNSIKSQLEKMNLGSDSDFSTIRILGNYINLDISNPVYSKQILNIEQIDPNHSLYRFCIMAEFDYPVNLTNFLKNPKPFIKGFFGTLFHSSSEN